MRAARLLTAAVLMVLTATSAVAKPPSEPAPSPLYLLEKASRPLLPDAAEGFLIQVDPADVAANPPSFLIELPDHALLEAVRTRFVDNQPDWKSWFGTLRYASGGDTAGAIHVGYHGGHITASIELDEGERFQIVGGVEESHRLVRLDPELSPRSCGLETPAAGGEVPFLGGQLRVISAPLTGCTANASLDLLVVYPAKGGPKPGFFDLSAAEESALFSFVRDSRDRANLVFTNNKINASYNLVGIVPLIGPNGMGAYPSAGLTSALLWMNSEPAELTELRTAFGADIVAAYIPAGWDADGGTCGVANTLRTGGQMDTVAGQSGPFNGRAYSAHRAGCGLAEYTLAHEIGHNYGMSHHDDTAFTRFVAPYARGYAFTDPNNVPRLTVMGRCSVGQACNRICAFSDPTRKYDGATINDTTGVPIGDDTHNNARLACESVMGYMDLKAAVANAAPTASFIVSCSGRTCTFNAGSSTDDGTIAGYHWDFGDGQTDAISGRIVSHTYASAGTYRIHLVVKDDGGKTNVKWNTASPWNPVYEGYLEIANCRQISGWAWDQVIPNTPILVDIYRDAKKVATIPADACRQDLANAGKGNGCHGFGYTPTSSWRDGRWHSAYVRVAGTSTNLTWSPRDLICNACMLCDLPIGETLPTGGQFTVGTQFSSSRNGQITQIGFYRASGETGPNTLRLWTDSGNLLASVTPTCSSSGWCLASIPPVTVTAGALYRVGVTVNTSYVKTGCGIPGGYTKDPLTAHQGVWSAGSGFPTSGTCSNFFVDVRFDI